MSVTVILKSGKDITSKDNITDYTPINVDAKKILNINKSNLAIYKQNDTVWPRGILSRNARLVQQLETNQWL